MDEEQAQRVKMLRDAYRLAMSKGDREGAMMIVDEIRGVVNAAPISSGMRIDIKFKD